MSLYSSSDCHYSTKCQFVNINIYTYTLVQSTKHERALLCTAFNKIQPKYGEKYHEHTNGTEEKYFILSENLIFRHFWVSFFSKIVSRFHHGFHVILIHGYDEHYPDPQKHAAGLEDQVEEGILSGSSVHRHHLGQLEMKNEKKVEETLFPYSCFAIKLEPGVICTVYYQERERERERETTPNI